MEHPKAVGDRSTLAIMLALQQAGHTIFFRLARTADAISRSKSAID
jgi:hypothetical protein